MTNYKDAICRIEVPNDDFEQDLGTGFFIDKNLILTCCHVIRKDVESHRVKISIKDDSENKIDVNVITKSEEYDVALLKVADTEFTAPKTLRLVKKEISEGELVKLFGYPNSGDERTTGLKINGNVNTINKNFNTDLTHDLVLKFETDGKADHAGFSGAPILNENNDVIAIFKRQDSLSFGGVSINRALSFFYDAEINISAQTITFKSYDEQLFKYFNPDVKNDCEGEMEVVCEEVEPNEIIEEVNQNLFFPSIKTKSIDEIIDHIQNDPRCCSDSFWKGWLELLTYVRIVNGNYEALNNITFRLTYDDLRELFDIPSSQIKDRPEFSSKIKGELDITLSFYFVEEESFFNVAKTILRKQKRDLTNTCTVFNSHNRNFSRRKFTTADKRKIIPNVATPENGGFRIKDKIHLGVLPLDVLSDEVANCTSLEEANYNLKELFKNAIK